MTVTFSQKRLISVWNSMIDRCHNPKNSYYKNYGERGIAVCKKWRNSFSSFFMWSLCNGYSEDLTIDRINNNLGYTYKNCRWVTFQENQNNRRDNVIVELYGEKRTVSQWSRILGIHINTLSYRLSKKFSQEELVKGRGSFTNKKYITSAPNGKFRVRVKINGKSISVGTFYTIEQAVLARDNYLENNK